MAEQHDIKYLTAFDGAKLHYREWRPADSRASVICLHGIQSHSGWFTDSCSFLASKGFRVLALDRRGSGMNKCRRGDTPSYRVLLNDVLDFVRMLREESEPLVHLFGISWGGKLASCFAAAFPGAVESLLLAAPGLAERVTVPAPLRLAIAACALFAPRTLYDIPINRPEMFTSNPERIRFIRDDERRLTRCTARMMVGSRAMDVFLRRNARRIRIPAMLMLAEHDPIIDNEGVEGVFRSFGSRIKKVRKLTGAWHTLEFEKDNRPFLQAVLEWLNERS